MNIEGAVLALIAAKCVLYYAAFRSAGGDSSSRRAAVAAVLRSFFGIVMGCSAFLAAAMLPMPGVFVVALMAGRAMAWALSSDIAYSSARRSRRPFAVGLVVNVAIDAACCVAFEVNPIEFLGPVNFSS